MNKGPLHDVLLSAGANKKSIADAVEAIRGGQSVNDANAEDQRMALEKYTVDLTERLPSRASSTRLLGVTKKFAGRSRYCSVAPRIIQC